MQKDSDRPSPDIQNRVTPHEYPDPDKAAFDRIFKRYGTDLAAFFRDASSEVAAKREAEKRAEDTEAHRK